MVIIISKNIEEYTSFAGIWRDPKKLIRNRIAIKRKTRSDVIEDMLSQNSKEGIIKLYKLNEKNNEAIPLEKIIVLNQVELLKE